MRKIQLLITIVGLVILAGCGKEQEINEPISKIEYGIVIDEKESREEFIEDINKKYNLYVKDISSSPTIFAILTKQQAEEIGKDKRVIRMEKIIVTSD